MYMLMAFKSKTLLLYVQVFIMWGKGLAIGYNVVLENENHNIHVHDCPFTSLGSRNLYKMIKYSLKLKTSNKLQTLFISNYFCT